MKTYYLIILFFAAVITHFAATEGASENMTEETKQIELLLTRIEAMQDVVFIRNGKEHSSHKAADHLRLKWKKAGRHVKTAEDFIELCGTKSSISGKPYQIRFPDGRLENSAAVLTELLQEIKRSNQ